MAYTGQDEIAAAEIRAQVSADVLRGYETEMVEALGADDDARERVRLLVESAEWAFVHRTDLQTRLLLAGLSRKNSIPAYISDTPPLPGIT